MTAYISPDPVHGPHGGIFYIKSPNLQMGDIITDVYAVNGVNP